MGKSTAGSEADDTSARPALPYAMIITAAMILASNHIIARYRNGGVPPIGLVFWRMTIGSVILLPFAARGVLTHRQLIPRALEAVFCHGLVRSCRWAMG